MFSNPENFGAALFPGGIERQEKRGQDTLVSNSLLPRENIPVDLLKGLGFTFLSTEDTLFNKWELPKGWSIVPTDHSMWSNVVDDKGKVRLEIFYKAAFYDRRAFMRFK